MAGEFDFISWIRAQQRPSDLVPVPIGDDLAALTWKPGELVLVGVDQVLDGVHFDSNIHSPRAIGKKAMNRNLSDCAAMACVPVAAVATVALPKGTSLEYCKELYLGLKEAGDAFGCEIVGGDTGTWNGKLVLTVTILGSTAGLKPITRKGARVGDGVFVTGSLGGSRLGRHMDFVPRVELARVLAQTGQVSSAIDLSDGLSRDLRHICQQSGVGAVIEANRIPIHSDAIEMRRDGQSPLEHALHDGEDYELLFTSNAPTERLLAALTMRHIQPDPGFTRIGEIIEPPDVLLEHNGQRTPLKPKGWEHTF